ncbi:MAG TPA: hypothetical protein VD978_13255 [Azospirillum sp.]|nr:hypothetical protein [Azospirillum sp.]
MKLFRALCTLLLVFFASSATADNMPKPLGIPLGATVDEAQAVLADSPMSETGISTYTKGPIFTVSGVGLNVQDLQQVTLIFDKERRLAALQMTMSAGGFGKPGYDRVLGYLKSQYPLKSNANPSVGNKFSLFETKDARVELDAPHMSFDMTVTYMTKAFHRVFIQTTNAEKKAKNQSESARF